MTFGKYIIFCMGILILFSGCCAIIDEYLPSTDTNGGEHDENGADDGGTTNGNNGGIEGDNGNGADYDEGQGAIHPGTIALFYVESLGSLSNSLDVFDSGGNVYTVNTESSSRAMIMYLPELDEANILKEYTSTSYSQNVVYPFTTDGRFFVLRDWGSEWTANNDQWTLEEFDPYTGNLISTTGFNGASFGIVGDKIYIVTSVSEDYWTGQVNHYGKLKVMDLGESSSYYADELKTYYSAGDKCTIYGVGDYLLCVRYYNSDYGTYFNVDTIDLETGDIDKELYTGILNDNDDYIYPGYNCLYNVVKDGSNIYIDRYPVNGEEEYFTFTLEGDETGIYVAEDDNILAVLVETGTKITSVLLHDLNTEDERWIEIEPYTAQVSYERIGAPFIVLE